MPIWRVALEIRCDGRLSTLNRPHAKVPNAGFCALAGAEAGSSPRLKQHRGEYAGRKFGAERHCDRLGAALDGALLRDRRSCRRDFKSERPIAR